MAEQTNLLPLLEKIATENNFTNYDIQVTKTSSGGANYSSILYLANITGDGDDLRLFVKAAIIGEKMREQSKINPYENEKFIYTRLKKFYRQLEKRYGLSEEHWLKFPKYYGADVTYLHEVLVLENLASQGFVTHDRLKPVDWEYATVAITELAKLHALSMAYEHENPQKFQEVVHIFQHRLFTEHEGNKTFYDEAVKSALKAVREENKDKLKAFLDKHDILKFNNFFNTVRRPVLAHADFRPSNMLHRTRSNGTVELVVIDYQTLQYGSPVIDLLNFIFTATDGPFRANFYHKLVHHYYAELGSALARLGLDVEREYSAKDFELELQEKLPFGLLSSVLMLPILTVDEDDAPKLDAELNIANMSNMRTGDLYVARLNAAVDDYVAWGILV